MILLPFRPDLGRSREPFASLEPLDHRDERLAFRLRRERPRTVPHAMAPTRERTASIVV